jgi:ubiquinone biosynthesis accessory factor UbiJ
MNTSPFSFLPSQIQNLLEPLLRGLVPPTWLVHELQQRLVLMLNHVLMQEAEAMSRIKRHSGKVLHAQWRSFSIRLLATPAGLLDLADENTNPDLRLEITQESPAELAKDALAGKTPPVKIEGDVQLAAEVGWLIEHVRWDIEEDLSRLIGDAPAHKVAQVAAQAAQSLRQWLAGRKEDAAAKAAS